MAETIEELNAELESLKARIRITFDEVVLRHTAQVAASYQTGWSLGRYTMKHDLDDSDDTVGDLLNALYEAKPQQFDIYRTMLNSIEETHDFGQNAWEAANALLLVADQRAKYTGEDLETAIIDVMKGVDTGASEWLDYYFDKMVTDGALDKDSAFQAKLALGK